MRFISLDVAEFDRLYDRFSHMEANACYRDADGREYFRRALFDSVLLVEFPFGLVRFTDYVSPVIRAHGLFDSKDVFGAQDELWRLAREVFTRFAVKYIEVIVPEEKRALRRLLLSLGMMYKRTLPDSMFNGTLYRRAALYRLKEDTVYGTR